MAGLALALKYAVPAVLAGGGLVAVVAVPDAVPAPARQVWIDSPMDGSRIDPGAVTVVAHAADGARLTSMTLEVDGARVATQSDLTHYDLLAGVEFTWEATEGQHFLVVTGRGLTSAVVAVDVGVSELGTAGPVDVPKPSPSPSATPSQSASATPSATPTTTRPSEPTPTRTPTKTPTRTPTKPPPSDPTIGVVTVTPSPISGPGCTGDVLVRAKVTNATGGSAVVTGGFNISKNIGGTVSGGYFQAVFRQRDLSGVNISGNFSVEVTVTNATGFDVAAASFSIFCSKD